MRTKLKYNPLCPHRHAARNTCVDPALTDEET